MDQEKLLKSVVRIHAYGRPVDFAKPFLSADRFKGVGTGFFVTPPKPDPSNLYIITCAHVVDGADSVTVMLPLMGMGEYTASVLALIPAFDLAVVVIPNTGGELSEQTVPLTLGTSDNMKLGQKLIAVGYPLGQTAIKVSDGVYSGFQDKLQHTVSISPGNSGGPLIDENNQVVGVNSSGIVSPEASNIGFAVPIEMFSIMADRVFHLSPGPPAPERIVRQPIFGFTFSPITRSHSKIVGACVGEHGGVQVVSMLPGSNMGEHVSPGDILVEFDGLPIDTMGEVSVPWNYQRVKLQDVLARSVQATRDYPVKYWDESTGECATTTAKPNLTTRNGMRKLHPPHDVVPHMSVLGLVIMPLLSNHLLCPQLTPTYAIKNPEELFAPSLVISHIYNGTLAQIEGPLHVGDEIGHVNGQEVSTLDDVRRALPKFEKINGHNAVTVKTCDGKMFIVNCLDALKCEEGAKTETLYEPDPEFLTSLGVGR